MELLDFVFDSTYSIIYNGASFANEIKKKSSYGEFVSEIKKPYIDLLGCSIRHFLIFDYLSKKYLKERFYSKPFDIENINDNGNPDSLYKKYEDSLMKKEIILITNYLANCFFSNTLDAITCNIFLDKKFLEIGSSLKALEVYNRFSSLDKSSFIPNDIDKKSALFLSLRFNVLEWQAKMFLKQYGYHNAFNFLKTISHPSNKLYVGVNTFKADEANILNDYSIQYSKSDYDGILLFNNTSSKLRNDEVIANGYGYRYSLALDTIFKSCDIDPYKTFAFYMDNLSPLYIKVANALKNRKIDVIAAPNNDFYTLNKEKILYGLDNVSIYEADINSLASIISDKINTFFVTVKSSNFESLRYSPENYLHITNDDIENGYVDGLYALNSVSEFIEVNGCIVYFIPTLSKTESIRVVETFLRNHSNFILEKSHQIFPFDNEGTTMYYAILRKSF